MQTKKQGKKQRVTSLCWGTLIYCDIQYVDEYIISTHLDCIVSPLHDKDTKVFRDEINGHVYFSKRYKKPHRHVMFLFTRPVSEETFSYMLENKIEKHGITCSGRELIYDMVGMARYFAHMDNPEKAQYRLIDYIYYGRVDDSILYMYLRKNPFEEDVMFSQILHDIRKHNITNIMDLDRMYEVTNHELQYYLHKHTGQIDTYVKANYYKCIEKYDTGKARIHHDLIRA